MPTLYEPHAQKKLVATIVCIAIIALLVVVTDQMKSKVATTASTEIVATSTPAPTSTVATTSTPMATSAVIAASSTPAPTASAVASSGYKDGSFTASSNYYVPHGSEAIQVTLTVKNGVITGSSVVNSGNDRDSAEYQAEFTSAYKSYVVGKAISGLQLDAVAGASDTTDGFNAALTQIASQAKA